MASMPPNFILPSSLNTYGNLFQTVLYIWIGYLVTIAIWRLYFSPIARFPGPKFAALTLWNEFYYDVICEGQYTRKIREYHEKYGPIIRINPYELHIDDPEFFDVLHVSHSKRKTNKWAWSMSIFQDQLSLFATLDHDNHKLRREPWSRYLSKLSISRSIHPLLIQPLVNQLCDRLASYRAARKPVKMVYAFSNLTSDIITQSSLPVGYHNLDKSEFSGEDYDAWMGLNKMIQLIKHFPWLFPLMTAAVWLSKLVNPNMNPIIRHQLELRRQVADLMRMRDDKQTTNQSTTTRTSLTQAILDSDLPPSQKSFARINAEAQNAFAAGTFTTTHALNTATYHVLSKPAMYARLMQELEDHFPNPEIPPTFQQLESMEYLVAIWYESLRTFQFAHRLQRVFPDYALPYKQWVIPPGTPVGMSAVLMNTNAGVFPDPWAFKPERWLPLSTVGLKLMKYNAALGGGSRVCVGRELGKAEFLATMAMMFKRFGKDMRILEMKSGDVEIKHDFLNPLSGERAGLWVTFHGDEQDSGKGSGEE